MKNQILILLIFLCSSCAFQFHRKPANHPEDHYFSKYKEESIRYILSFEPKKYGTYDELSDIEQAERIYQLLGQIDLENISPIHSRFLGKDLRYKSIFRLANVRQISYANWLEMKSDVMEAYKNGKYVFKKGFSFYTLSGLRLNVSNIEDRIFERAQRHITNLNREDLALSIFNRETLYPVDQTSGLILPTGGYARARAFNFLKEDFISQVGRGVDLSPIELINYNYKKPSALVGNYKIYRSQKYQNFLNDEMMRDSETACDTRFYYRALSRSSDAQKFMNTLLEHKESLMEELSLSNNEYDELLVLSLGILSVESKMGKSVKYKIKEDIRIGKLNFGQLAINLIKRLKGRSDDNSRGLTQIKNIGPLLENTRYAYLEHANLDNPENAAIATMFVLKEKLGYLRHFANRHSNITSDNWADYLYYFYQGSSSQITKGLATPPLNLRIQKILEVKEDSMVFTNCD